MTNEATWFPMWMLWLIGPWLVLHVFYDLSIRRDLRAQPKPAVPEPRTPLNLFRSAEAMRENRRRLEAGDPLARLVSYYDWVMVAGFVLVVGYRVFLGWSARWAAVNG